MRPTCRLPAPPITPINTKTSPDHSFHRRELEANFQNTGICFLKGTGLPNVKTLALGISRVITLVIMKTLVLTTLKAQLQLKISVPLANLAEESNK